MRGGGDEECGALRPLELDTVYVRQLFALAYDRAICGYPWEKPPPGLDSGGAAKRSR